VSVHILLSYCLTAFNLVFADPKPREKGEADLSFGAVRVSRITSQVKSRRQRPRPERACETIMRHSAKSVLFMTRVGYSNEAYIINNERSYFAHADPQRGFIYHYKKSRKHAKTWFVMDYLCM
jgi:hypothetical protein